MITMPRVLPAALALAFIVGCGPHVAAQQLAMHAVSQYPLFGDNGQSVANHTVTLAAPIDQLPGVVSVGNPRGKTALVEFYDLNCPFCRIASVDIGDLVDTDPELKLVLVPYPVLGPASVAASRVELAVAKLGTPRQFYEFHRRIYAQHGTADGLRALAVAGELGLDQRALRALGDSAQTTQTMKAHLALGSTLGLTATPSFILGNLAILGYPGRESLQAMVEAADRCGKPKC
jgi:protein-disulfide isomerase